VNRRLRVAAILTVAWSYGAACHSDHVIGYGPADDRGAAPMRDASPDVTTEPTCTPADCPRTSICAPTECDPSVALTPSDCAPGGVACLRFADGACAWVCASVGSGAAPGGDAADAGG
jgi:hypothetical protein